MKVKFDISEVESRLVNQIILRAGVAPQHRMKLELDIIACHCNGTPLALELLAAAPPADFLHDIQGIQKHINRTTGKLDPVFEPRFAMANHRKAA